MNKSSKNVKDYKMPKMGKSYGKGKPTNAKKSAYYGKDSKGAKPYRTDISTSRDARYDNIKSNDIEWWNKSPLYADATRIPFNRISGVPINQGLDQVPASFITPWLGTQVNDAPAGIIAVDFAPTLGTTSDANSPSNRAFTSLYGEIYSKTTGAMQFQQADLAMFVTSFSSVMALIATVKRALGVSQLYNGLNYYYPKHLITAMGFDPDKIIGHQDEIRMKLNDAILSFNNLKIPDFMSIYKRQYQLCHNVYADEDDTMAQLVIFRPRGYYKYHEVDTSTTPPGPSYCSFEQISYGSPIDVNTYIADIESALNVWRNSSDLPLIAGSIQRAFSDSQLITLDFVNDGDAITPIVDRNMTWQINNMLTCDLDLTSLRIDQNPVTNELIQQPKIAALAAGATNYSTVPMAVLADYRNYVLNSFDNDTGPEFQMEATRLIPILPTDREDTDLKYWNTEIVTQFHLYYTYTYANQTTPHLQHLPLKSVIFQNAFSFPGDCKAIEKLTQFKHGPRIIVLSCSNNANQVDSVCRIGDLYKYTTVDREALIGLNATALQSVYQTDLPILNRGQGA